MPALDPAPQPLRRQIAGGITLLTATSLLIAQGPPPGGAPPNGGRPPFDGPPPFPGGRNGNGPRSNRPGGDPNAKKENRVSITTEGAFRVIKSNGWPEYTPQFPRRGNPNTAWPQDYTFRVTLDPKPAAQPRHPGGWFTAVGLNGVPFEPGTAETWNNDPRSGWRYEAHTGFLNLGLDEHNAHVQPTGAYHYHAMPTGLVQKLGGDDGRMLQVAWAADGYPVFTANCSGTSGKGDKAEKTKVRAMKPSYRLKTGTRPTENNGPGGKYDGRFTQDWEYAEGSGDLDEFNGHTAPTPAHPEGEYHYHITTAFPFLPRGWKGTPDQSFSKGGPPPGGGFGGGFGGPGAGPNGPGGPRGRGGPNGGRPPFPPFGPPPGGPGGGFPPPPL